MAYNPLNSESGSDPLSRRKEADRICLILEDKKESMSKKEQDFLDQIAQEIPVSVNQLFWLRDIKDKYL